MAHDDSNFDFYVIKRNAGHCYRHFGTHVRRDSTGTIRTAAHHRNPTEGAMGVWKTGFPLRVNGAYRKNLEAAG